MCKALIASKIFYLDTDKQLWIYGAASWCSVLFHAWPYTRAKRQTKCCYDVCDFLSFPNVGTILFWPISLLIISSGSSGLFTFGCFYIMFFWKSITWQAWKRPIEIPSIYKEYNPSQKSLATLRRKPSPASPLSMLLQWCRLFFRYFFEPAKQHWAGGIGEKEATVQCYCLRL